MNANDNSSFPLTRLSLIERVKDLDGSIRRQALAEFAESYRPSLISFLVKCKGIPFDQAEDIVHDFMLNKIMNGKVLELAGKKGRFRSLLRACLQNFLIDQLRKDQRVPKPASFEWDDSDEASSQAASPIDQVWAIALFREALTMMRRDSDYWGLFKDRVLTQPPLPYDQIIEKNGFDSPNKASNALMTAKRQFNRIIEELISKQSYLTEDSSEEELEIEIEYLRSQLADSNLLEMVIDSLDGEPNARDLERSASDSIFSDRLLLIDESADANWHKSDVSALFVHLLAQPLNQVASEIDKTESLQSIFETRKLTNLQPLLQLKQHFNMLAKTGSGPLPERVNVAMTFACIATYLLIGGQLEDITSTRRSAMSDRISQLTKKEWIPIGLRTIFREAVEELNKELNL